MTADQVIAALGTFVATYLFYQALGPRDTNLFFSREQKATWDATIREGLGRWLVISSICATLTGFATYLFLLGSTKLFGLFALATGITIALSSPVTKALSRPFLKDERIGALFRSNDQVSSVIATLFWSNTNAGIASARIAKWVSLVVILSIIWLECTAFIDLSFWIAGYTDPSDRALLPARFIAMFVVAFAIIFFVLRYGIRGFVFADLLHTPIIALAAVSILVGALWISRPTWPEFLTAEFWSPVLSQPDPVFGVPPGLIFATHVLVLNLFQITCTEHHWFRMWLFGETELSRQSRGTAFTGLIWLIMLPVGFIAFSLSNTPGEAAIGALVPALGQLFSWFSILFWVGATAALFSTADMQIYSALLVSRFEPRTSTLHDISLTRATSLASAVVAATAFGLLYMAARAAALPLEKIIFVIVPMCIVLLPGFLHFRWGYQVRPEVLILSFVSYVSMAAWGFLVSAANFSFTLSAVFLPLLISVFSLPFIPRRG